MKKSEQIRNMANCMLSILDILKLHDTGTLCESKETLSEMMFRRMKVHEIDINKELGFDHIEPIYKKEIESK